MSGQWIVGSEDRNGKGGGFIPSPSLLLSSLPTAHYPPPTHSAASSSAVMAPLHRGMRGSAPKAWI